MKGGTASKNPREPGQIWAGGQFRRANEDRQTRISLVAQVHPDPIPGARAEAGSQEWKILILLVCIEIQTRAAGAPPNSSISKWSPALSLVIGDIVVIQRLEPIHDLQELAGLNAAGAKAPGPFAELRLLRKRALHRGEAALPGQPRLPPRQK